MRPFAFLIAFALPLLPACVHEPEAAWDYDPSYEAASAPVVRSDVSVQWAGPAQAEVVALPPSPRDKPAPDPIPFRIGAGHGALGEIDLAPCERLGLDPGYVKLRVTFHKNGHVVHAAVESPTPPPQEALDCVADQVAEAAVPRFDGSDATLSKSLFVRPGAEGDDVYVRKGGAPTPRVMTHGVTAP